MAMINNGIDLANHYPGIRFSDCRLARCFTSTFVKWTLIKSQGTALAPAGKTVKGSKDETHPSTNRTVPNNFCNG